MPNDKEYMAEYMLRRYYKRRAAAIAQLGGRCAICGATYGLEFDHIDPSAKTAALADLFASAADARLQAEVAKCQLLCERHHAEKTAGEARRRAQVVVDRRCACGRVFERTPQYVGHRAWCKAA